MTREEAEGLAAVIDSWAAEGAPMALACAQDVFYELQEAVFSADPDIQVIPHYEPGQWKLTLHDACDVTGGYAIGDAVIVSHKGCTVIAENR